MLPVALFSSFQELCSRHQRMLVISHVRPDGDAYGSSLALTLCLRAMGKDVVVLNADGLSPLFEFLPGSATLAAATTAPPEADRLIIAVDCADQRRLGSMLEAWNRPPDVNIDHHVSNSGYAALNLIDAAAPATAQVLYELITTLKWPLPPEVAANLYVGLMTDTGCFCFRQTTAHTFETAARLVEAGADPTDLAQSCYQNYRPERLLLMKEVLNGLQFGNRNRIAWFRLSPEIYARSGALPDETDGLTEYLQAVRTVEVAFLIEEMPDGFTRASLRSRGLVDVQKICTSFGGGGHRLAAGLRTRLDPDALEAKLQDAIAEQLPA